MLKSLFIQNYAIIDEINIVFSPGMNVITGETGAGKSILMGALSLILGDRADTSVLLSRDKKCIVEGVFAPDNETGLTALLTDFDVDAVEEENAEIIIRREIASNGKSRAFVNDSPVNLEQLRQITSLLVDLHRQFDTLALGEVAFQLNVLDALANNKRLLHQYHGHFQQWKNTNDALEALREQKKAFTKEYDYNKFLYDELEEAAFSENEIEDAEQELKMLENSENIKTALSSAVVNLTEGDQPTVQQLKSLHHQLDSFSKYHHDLEDVNTRLNSVYLELRDIASDIEKINNRIQFDPEKINRLNERISTGYRLLKKHGLQSTSQLLALQKEIAGKLEAVLGVDDRIAALEEEVKQSFGMLERTAAELSARRKKQVSALESQVNKLLVRVGMPNARLKVMVESKAADATGMDDVDFLFDANKSNRFEPVRKVASGGELSRLMLSIKSLVADSMDMPTLIFDEIDTGISGEAARQVGVIMHELSRQRQLITITHQPQIAGKANTHLFVYKDIQNELVRTNIRALEHEERITTIAKMLSGEKPTAAALENAREMVMN